MGAAVISNNRSGFTLIEFCVAVVIMMVGLLGLLEAVNYASLQNLGSMLRNEAISLADEQMVLTKASVYDNATFTALAGSSGLITRKMRNSLSNYSTNRTVASDSTNSKEVVVRVSWRYKGNKQNHMITTLIVNPTPQ